MIDEQLGNFDVSYWTNLAAGAVCAGLASGAAAQGFDGPYFGVTVGGATGSVDATGTVNGGAFTGNEDLSGGFAGLRGGYIFEDDGLFYGFEVTAQFGGPGYDGNAQTGGVAYIFDIDERYEIRGIIGREVSDNLLFFGSLGYTHAETSTFFTGTTTTGTDGSAGNSRDGFNIGVGLARAFSPALVGTAEIVYTDLGTATYVGGAAPVNTVAQDVSFTELRLGLNYRF
ncbi:MAG: outer membrane beta-barrel protein [Pseudomonadota bacterium]